MIITIDIDNTIVDTCATFKTLCEKYGYELKFPITKWDFSDQKESVYKFLLERTSVGDLDETLFEGKLWDTSIADILNKLAEIHTIIFVSSRSKRMLKDTQNQLRNLGIDIDKMQVVLLGSYDKIVQLQGLGSELHIDDSEHVIKECKEHSLPVIMYTNDILAYNHYLRDTTITITDWKDLESLLRIL